MDQDTAVIDDLAPGQAAPDLGYAVTVEAFSGPLDLLLYLVRRAEVDIAEIPIAEIATQFAITVASWTEMDLELAGEFVLMAATLLELKARLVAPPLVDPDAADAEAEEEDVVDLHGDLIRKLLIFRKYKEITLKLTALEEQQALRHWRRMKEDIPDDPEEAAGIDLDNADPYVLASTWELIDKRINGLGPRTVMVDSAPLEVTIQQLITRLERDQRSTLRAVLNDETSLTAKLTTVMALLESSRTRHIESKQFEQWGDVNLRWRPEPERAIVTLDFPPDPDDGRKRRRRPPLATWHAQPGSETSEAEADHDAADEAPIENDEQRFTRELEEACRVEAILGLTADVEVSFAKHLRFLRGEPEPPPPPPPEPEPPKAAKVPKVSLDSEGKPKLKRLWCTRRDLWLGAAFGLPTVRFAVLLASATEGSIPPIAGLVERLGGDTTADAAEAITPPAAAEPGPIAMVAADLPPSASDLSVVPAELPAPTPEATILAEPTALDLSSVEAAFTQPTEIEAPGPTAASDAPLLTESSLATAELAVPEIAASALAEPTSVDTPVSVVPEPAVQAVTPIVFEEAALTATAERDVERDVERAETPAALDAIAPELASAEPIAEHRTEPAAPAPAEILVDHTDTDEPAPTLAPPSDAVAGGEIAASGARHVDEPLPNHDVELAEAPAHVVETELTVDLPMEDSEDQHDLAELEKLDQEPTAAIAKPSEPVDDPTGLTRVLPALDAPLADSPAEAAAPLACADLNAPTVADLPVDLPPETSEDQQDIVDLERLDQAPAIVTALPAVSDEPTGVTRILPCLASTPPLAATWPPPTPILTPATIAPAVVAPPHAAPPAHRTRWLVPTMAALLVGGTWLALRVSPLVPAVVTPTANGQSPVTAAATTDLDKAQPAAPTQALELFLDGLAADAESGRLTTLFPGLISLPLVPAVETSVLATVPEVAVDSVVAPTPPPDAVAPDAAPVIEPPAASVTTPTLAPYYDRRDIDAVRRAELLDVTAWQDQTRPTPLLPESGLPPGAPEDASPAAWLVLWSWH